VPFWNTNRELFLNFFTLWLHRGNKSRFVYSAMLLCIAIVQRSCPSQYDGNDLTLLLHSAAGKTVKTHT